MIYCVADVDEQIADLLSLWVSTCGVSIPHFFLVLVDRSACSVEIYRSGVLVARSAIYKGVFNA